MTVITHLIDTTINMCNPDQGNCVHSMQIGAWHPVPGVTNYNYNYDIFVCGQSQLLLIMTLICATTHTHNIHVH